MSQTIFKELGQQITALRKEQKMSQRELAEKAGLDRTFINGIERGKQNMSVKSLIFISEALGVELMLGFIGTVNKEYVQG